MRGDIDDQRSNCTHLKAWLEFRLSGVPKGASRFAPDVGPQTALPSLDFSRQGCSDLLINGTIYTQMSTFDERKKGIQYLATLLCSCTRPIAPT